MPTVKKIRKGVITVGGLGTRFLPATKAMPKEMLPVLDKPVLQYIVEEMVESGITEILFVTSSQKRAIEDHFDRDYDYEAFLKKQGKFDRIKPLVELCEKVQFFYTRQPAPLGNGDAMLRAREFCAGEPFVFSDGDSIIDANVPVVKQLLKIYQKKKKSLIGVQRLTDPSEMTKYGNVYADLTKTKKLYRVKKIYEKPKKRNVSPQGLIIAGMRYVFSPDFWPFLERQKKGRSGEFWVADAVHAYARKRELYAYEFEGRYFDTGNQIALLKAAIHFAGKDPKMKSELIGLFE